MRFQERCHGAQRRARIFRLSILTVDLTWLDGEVFQSLESEKRQKVLDHPCLVALHRCPVGCVLHLWRKKRMKLTNMSAHAAYVVLQTSWSSYNPENNRTSTFLPFPLQLSPSWRASLVPSSCWASSPCVWPSFASSSTWEPWTPSWSPWQRETSAPVGLLLVHEKPWLLHWRARLCDFLLLLFCAAADHFCFAFFLLTHLCLSFSCSLLFSSCCCCSGKDASG